MVENIGREKIFSMLQFNQFVCEFLFKLLTDFIQKKSIEFIGLNSREMTKDQVISFD